MKRLIGLILRVVFGLFAGIMVSLLSSPRFWPAEKVLNVARNMIRAGNGPDAARLYRFGPREPEGSPRRDAFFQNACLDLKQGGFVSEAILVCEQWGRGPKRLAQADALFNEADLRFQRGEKVEAVVLYKDLMNRYWDYPQGAVAHRRYLTIRLEEILSSEATDEVLNEVQGFFRTLDRGGWEDEFLRNGAVYLIKRTLDGHGEPDPDLLSAIKSVEDTEGGKLLAARLGVLCRYDARGADLRQALVDQRLPVLDTLEDAIRFSISSEDSPPSRELIFRDITQSAPSRVVEIFNKIGAAADGLAVDVARRWIRDGHGASVAGLLMPVVERGGSGSQAAAANFLLASIEKRQGR